MKFSRQRLMHPPVHARWPVQQMSWLFGMAATLVFAAAISTPALADKKDDTVRFASQQTLPSLDKYYNVGATSFIVSEAVWDTLIFRDPETGEYKGSLATAWRWIGDTTLELDLRE